MVNVAVFASGSGTNFENLVKSKIDNCNISVLVTDSYDAYALERAKQLKVDAFTFIQKEYGSKAKYETAILELLKKYDIDLIVLAGYMRFVGEVLLKAYPNKIINIHPAYLPFHKGAHGIHDSFVGEEGFGGVTVHYVDAGVDTGPIIKQTKIIIDKDMDEASFEKIVHEEEYRLYPAVLSELCKEEK